MKFELGDIAATRWSQGFPGVVVGVVSTDSVRQKVTLYFEREMNRLEYNNSDLILLKRAPLKEEEMAKDVTVISLKPLQSEALIKGNNWTHVILRVDTGEAVAAFTSEEDAESFFESVYFDDDEYIIREVA